MPIDPQIGEAGGQQYDVARAIRTFLGQMAEGGINVAAAVIKELLQNADDAEASEVHVVLDERPPGDGIPAEYQPLLVPAILVRNNAPFKLRADVASQEKDDFTAICDVASGHKRAQATAAGRFGIGFNSVYFLTDTPVLFSRREVHVFDLLHHIFKKNGWRFLLDQFPADAGGVAGPIKMVLERAIPKVALGSDRNFGQLAGEGDDYKQAILRLPLRVTGNGGPVLHQDRFPTLADRLAAVEAMAQQAARSVLLLKSVEKVSFDCLTAAGIQSVASVTITPPTPEFRDFVASVKRLGKILEPGDKLACNCERQIRFVQWKDGAEESTATWSFFVKHVACFDDPELLRLRQWLDRNDEKAIPWASLAVPLDAESLEMDGAEIPSWRVFLPLLEPGPCACIVNAALFVGPSRQRVEFRLEGSDEATRKTEWNKQLIAHGVVPLMRDASLELLDLVPGLIQSHPKEYLSLFPIASDGCSADSLSAYVQAQFAGEPWFLRVYDIWQQPIEILVGDADNRLLLEMVPEWLTKYQHTFAHFSAAERRFIPWALGDAIRERLGKNNAISFNRGVSADIAAAVLTHADTPKEEHLAPLLLAILRDQDTPSANLLTGLWALKISRDGTLVRYDPKMLYIFDHPDQESPIHRHLCAMGIVFEATEWVSPDVGLPCIKEEWIREFRNLHVADVTTALELLERVAEGQEHDSLSQPEAIVPLVEFLLEVDPVRLSQKLRLAFMVKTASTASNRREMGVVLLKPEPASQDDNAVWETLLRPAFAQVDPGFARELRRLIHARPQLLVTLKSHDCDVAIASAECSFDVLHTARTRCPARFAGLADSANTPANKKYATKASLAVLGIAESRWSELSEEQRITALALPVHRLADGNFVPLCDATGTDAASIAERFRLQSEDDIRDAPVSLPECQLLHSGSRLLTHFYRRTVGLEEHGRAAVLKDALRQIGGAKSENSKLLQYLAAHYWETVNRLSESAEPGHSEDLSEIRRLFAAARLVPCLDGEWRSVEECVDGWEVAEYLRKRGWDRRSLPDLVKELFYAMHVVSLVPEVRRLLQNLGCKLSMLDSGLLSQHAIGSESPRLSLFERLRLLAGCPVCAQEVARAAVLADAQVASLSGTTSLKCIELLAEQTQELPVQVIRYIAPTATDIRMLSQECKLQATDVEKALRALQVPVADANIIHERLGTKFAQMWSDLGEQDRLDLLTYVARRPSLEQSLYAQIQSLPIVLVNPKGKEWRGLDQVVAPKWVAANPPRLLPEQTPAVRGVPEDLVGLWNRWCGISSLDAIVLMLVQQVKTHRSDKWMSFAKELYDWLDRLSQSDHTDDHESYHALQEVSWVLARKGTEIDFLAPAHVVIHDGADVLSQRFWVAACPLPRFVGHSFEQFGFVKSPLPTTENLLALADCLQLTTVSDGHALCSIYQLILDMVADDDHLKTLWLRIAGEGSVYHLFRGIHGPVSQMAVFLGDDKFGEDYDSVLFCLKAANPLPKGLVKTYRELEVENRPTAQQAISALCRFTGSQKQLRVAYRGLVEIFLTGATSLVPSDEFRVPACSATYEPVERCFWSEEFGHSKRIKGPCRKYLIDVDDPSARRLMEWAANGNAMPIRRLESIARRELGCDVRIIADNPAAQQVLGPWRELLAELYRDGSILRDTVRESGITPPSQSIEITLVQRIYVRYVLPDGTIIEQDDGWEGPPVVHDGRCRIHVSAAVGAKNYIGAGEDLDVLHRAIANELVALICLCSDTEPQDSLTSLLLTHLDRPAVRLERMRREYQEHFFHQYHDQVADPDFANLFDEYRKTRKGTARQEQLEQEMQRILSEQYVNARQEQIRGYGYDAFSVFAELLQNAEDAYLQRHRLGMESPPEQSASFRYAQQNGQGCELCFEHYGRPFNYARHGNRYDPNYSRDVEGVLRSAGSFKPHSTSQVEGESAIGRFGLGFKSVYLITDRPRIHSGFWHFAIEASCLPAVLSSPADLSLEATRIELPLRDSTQEFRDENGSQLLNLMPFLREVSELRLQNSNGTSRTLTLSVEHRAGLGDSTTVERIAISGVDHVRGGIVRLLRLRHYKHAGQLAVYLAEDGQPSTWSGAFTRDAFVSLPLLAKLGCGIAVSHRFEIQSGRTHFVTSTSNTARVEELAELLRKLPEGMAACTGYDIAKSHFVNRFWGLWRWDFGDTECQELRKKFAAELAEIPQRQPFVPTLDGQTCVSFEQGPVFYFDGIPEKVRDAIVKIGLPVQVGERTWTAATPRNIVSDSFLQAYMRTCRFADIPVAANLLRIDWQAIGASCRAKSCMADHPELLNAVAESLPDWKKEQVLEWLPHCKVRGRDAHGNEIKAQPCELLAPGFKGMEVLPRRFLSPLDDSYNNAAVALLDRAGLLRRPTAPQVCKWITQESLTQDESSAILAYLAQDRRFMDADYRHLEQVFRSDWFPSGNSRLSSADAFANTLIPEEIVAEPLFSTWLGISNAATPPPLRPERLGPDKTKKWLSAVFDWWRVHGDEWTGQYEQKVYPDGRLYAVRGDFHTSDLRDRREWLSLFLTGALHTMGRQKPVQHSGFLRLCDRKGWLNTFADPVMNAANWMHVLEEYLEENSDQLAYYQWMSQFLRIYHLARWLPEYVEGFLAVNRARNADEIPQIVTPGSAAMFQGGGPIGPAIHRTLGLGFCFVIRELTRQQVLTTPLAWPHCFVPSESTRDVLWRAGCDDVADNSSRGIAWSPLIYSFLEQHLGPEKANFLGAFDLPLIAMAEGVGPADRLPPKAQ